MKRLYVDLDGTLAECAERLARTAVDGKLGPRTFCRDEMLRDLPIPWAVEAMRAFASCGWYVVILSARGFADAEAITRDWLDINKIPCHGVLLVRQAEDKPAGLAADRPDLFIDDFMGAYETGRPRFCSRVYEACMATGVRTEPFRNNWPEIIHRVLGVSL